MNKEKYIEKELEKWKQYYNIPFENEFDVRALLSLQYDFMSLPDDYVKSKKDLIEAMSRIKRDLYLKPKSEN